jgi:TonB family protein
MQFGPCGDKLIGTQIKEARMRLSFGVGLCAALMAGYVVAMAQEKMAKPTPSTIPAADSVKVYVPGKHVTTPELLPADYSHALVDKCELNLTGEAEYSLIVDAEGIPRDVTFLHAIGNDLDLLGLKLVRADRFKSAQFNDSPVAAGMTVKIKIDACVVTETDASGQAAHRIRLRSAPQQELSVWKNAPTEFALTLTAGDGVLTSPQKIGVGVTPPVPVYLPSPVLSEEARQAKYQGEVMVQIIVDTDGIPQNPRVVRPLGMGLDEKAIEVVRHYRFKPAMKDGKPVPAYMTIAINFRL